MASLSHLADALHEAKAAGRRIIPTVSNGGTPMTKGFKTIRAEVLKWAQGKSPGRLILVTHATDGESTDGDPSPEVKGLSEEVTKLGHKLLVTNIHMSEHGTAAGSKIFPTDEDADHFDAHGKRLFAMSSLVPPEIIDRINAAQPDESKHIKVGARMMAYNASLKDFMEAFAAGSSVAAQ